MNEQATGGWDKETLQASVAELQASITKRDARIAELETQLERRRNEVQGKLLICTEEDEELLQHMREWAEGTGYLKSGGIEKDESQTRP